MTKDNFSFFKEKPDDTWVESFECLKFHAAVFLENDLPILAYMGCPVARFDNDVTKRTFAHTFHIDDTICLSVNLRWLCDEAVWGIMAHEFGHLLADKHYKKKPDLVEEQADQAAGEFLGVSIYYKRPDWIDDNQKGIQVISLEEIKRLKGDKASWGGRCG